MCGDGGGGRGGGSGDWGGVFLPPMATRRWLQRKEHDDDRNGDGDGTPTSKAYADMVEENETLRMENRNMFILLEVRHGWDCACDVLRCSLPLVWGIVSVVTGRCLWGGGRLALGPTGEQVAVEEGGGTAEAARRQRPTHRNPDAEGT